MVRFIERTKGYLINCFRKSYGFMFYAMNLAVYLLFIVALTGVAASLDPSFSRSGDVPSDPYDTNHSDNNSERLLLYPEPNSKVMQ